jgi:nucleoside-specific outer membrane channel protein Tsx
MTTATTIGYEISSDEIIRAAAEQRAQEQTAARATTKTVGRFSYDPTTGTVSGPAAYMAERYETRMAQINAGRDTVANMGFARGSDTVLAVLVSLQTDYAAWAGMREFNSRLLPSERHGHSGRPDRPIQPLD